MFLIVAGFIQTIRFEREEKGRINALEAILPICAWCKKYRAEDGEWLPIEQYLSESGRELSHGICPSCVKERFHAQG